MTPPQHQTVGLLKSPVSVVCLHLTIASGKISGSIDNELQELQACHIYTRVIDGTAQQKIHSSNQLHLRPSAEFCYSPTLAEENDKTVRKCRMITTLEKLYFHSDLSGSCSHFNSTLVAVCVLTPLLTVQICNKSRKVLNRCNLCYIKLSLY